MKKIMFLFALIFLFGFTNVKANTIYNIDVDVYINIDGTANITETWDVKGNDGSEWYHPFRDLEDGHHKITNYTVSMDGEALTYKKWDINESLSQKAGYYGINYTDTDTELCFGKNDFNRHTFTVQYDIENFIYNTDDAQVMYWTFFPIFQNVDFQKYSIVIRSYYSFPDSLATWGYGDKGFTYVENGLIKSSLEENSDANDTYIVILAQFDKGTFETINTHKNFKTIDDVKSAASEGSYEYDYGYNLTIWQKIMNFLRPFIVFIPMLIIGIISAIIARKNGYGYKDNKTIDKKNVPNFRDIPCKKDIYYANALIALNQFNYKETNILGAIILKWVKQEKVGFIKQDVGIFKKEQSCLDLRKKPKFEISDEEKLFNMMFEASEDGILEPNEFKNWARNNYDSFFNVFKSFKDNEVNKLRSERHIYTRTNKEECKQYNVMDDKIYEDSKELYGLKKFLQEFSSIDKKETLEVHIWEEYLMFAYLFGIADKVAQQLKKLYPELLEQNQNMDYTTIMMINHFSTTTVSAASSARSAAEHYSAGGGGFNFGGGGGGAGGGGGFSGGGSR